MNSYLQKYAYRDKKSTDVFRDEDISTDTSVKEAALKIMMLRKTTHARPIHSHFKEKSF